HRSPGRGGARRGPADVEPPERPSGPDAGGGRRVAGGGRPAGAGGDRRRAPGAADLCRLVGVRRSGVRAALAPARQGRRRRVAGAAARRREAADGRVHALEPALPLPLPAAPGQGAARSRSSRRGDRLGDAAGGGRGRPVPRAGRRDRLVAGRGVAALGDCLPLVRGLGAALGRPVPANRLASALGAHPVELPRATRRRAADAVGLRRDLGTVLDPAGDGATMVVRLIVSYRGAAYAGWQRQDNALAVQEVLEEALGRLLGSPVRAVGASRTDAGVHARGQAAHLEPAAAVADWPLRGLVHGTNHLLPDDVRVLAADRMAAGFHARRAARGKEYCYRLSRAAVVSPLDAPYVLQVPARIDAAAMAAAASALVGRHDFS